MGQVGYWLGIGIASLVTLFDPELVVVTGGLSVTGELLLSPLRANFKRFVFARDRRTLPSILPPGWVPTLDDRGCPPRRRPALQ